MVDGVGTGQAIRRRGVSITPGPLTAWHSAASVTSVPLTDTHTHTHCAAALLQVMPTPLTRLRWWRVCLDEAQMVESSTAKAAEMALKLHTVHRW